MQQGGSQYGISPEVAPYNRSHVLGITGAHDLSAGHHSEHLQQQQPQQQLLQQQQKKSGDGLPEAASPISSRPPARSSVVNFDDLVPVSGGFPDEEALAGEESERGTAGNRWPRQETLALLKIRSEMDSAFRDATLKGPLWEDVSRKLTELGYIRSAKKCKEKFENVHKYYKRTKEGRAGRQDGKSYRFFSQLEALHSSNPALINQISSGIGSSNLVSNAGRVQSPAVVTAGAGQMNRNLTTPAAPTTSAPSPAPRLAQNLHGIAADLSAGIAAGISFSSGSSSSSSDSDGLEDLNPESRKRKRPDSSSQKMMDFFESLMKQVMEKQEAMQQRFLETIEKRENDRMIREEAWKRQEMAKLNREQEILAQERALSASRDATVIAFLQKITGQTIQIPLPVTIQAPQPQSSLPPSQHHHQLHLHHQEPQPHQQPQQQPQHHHQQQQQQPQPQQQQQKQPPAEIIRHVSSSDIVPVQEQEIGIGFDATSSRWPKSEVHALIKLRSGLDSRYQEAGPKGPLWEEISAGMNRLGYSRSAKRCKEKWENINKYFKKVKESNKKRPEDAKTCPYFHQLDALYRKKNLNSSSSSQNKQDPELLPQQQRNTDLLAIMPPPPSETENKGSTTNNNDSYNEGNNAGGSGVQVPTSNGGLPTSFFQSANEEDANKPEDIVKELIEQQQAVMDDYDKLEEPDSDNMEQDEEDEDEEEEQKLAYKVQFQRQNTVPSTGKAGSFLAMVQ